MITTIIFDLGKVIIGFDHFAICKKLAEHSTRSAEQIYSGIFSCGLEDRFDRGAISPELFFRTAAGELEIRIGMAGFRNIWRAGFSLNTGTAGIISRLSGRYRLLCLSNTNQWHFQYCAARFPVLECFDSFVLSYEIGEKKPAAKIYAEALRRARCPARECLYIDDIAEFVQAAEGLGMRGIHFVSAQMLARKLHDMGILDDR